MVMKKLFFSLVLAFMALMNVNAQEVQLATLQKADGLQVFYGSDAFREAMAAAENGNTISLGAGAYSAVDITKAVKIYGSGYETKTNTEAQETGELSFSTRLVGDFSIAIDSVNGQANEGLYIEGVYSNNRIMVIKDLTTASFVKCRFQNFAFWKTINRNDMTNSKNIQFIQCRFASWFEPGNTENISIVNCIINYLGRNRPTSSAIVQNSVIFKVVSNFRAIFKNVVIGHVWGYDNYRSHPYDFENAIGTAPLNAACSVYNSIFCGTEDFLQSIITKSGNWQNIDFQSIFKKEVSEYSDDNMYELTDESKTTYLGTDGKEIGLYGGANPFSPILTIPRVVKKDIAAQTADGKLKVNIKVETGDSSF